MNAAQMDKEFEIAYEAIADNGAPGYTEFEKSILLTQAQSDIITDLVNSGIEKTDIRALVIGPHIKNTEVAGFGTAAAQNPSFTTDTNGSDSIQGSWDAGDGITTVSVTQVTGSELFSSGSIIVSAGDRITLTFDTTSEAALTFSCLALGIDSSPINDDFTEEQAYSYISSAGGTIQFIFSTEDIADNGEIVEFKVEVSSPSYSEYEMYNGVSFENDNSDVWLLVNEKIQITKTGAIQEVKPVDHTFIDANSNNPFKRPITGQFYWRLLQYGSDFNNPNFILPEVSSFYKYFINYLEKPTPIFVPGTTAGDVIDGVTSGASVTVTGIGTGIDVVADGLDCGFNDIIHRDIILKAAKLGAAYVSDPESLQLLLNSYKGN